MVTLAPSPSQAPAASLTERVHAWEAGAHVIAALFLRETPVLALADGGLLLGEGAVRRIEAHPDAGLLRAIPAGDTVLSGGDDGRVVRTRLDGGSETLDEAKGRWVDALAAGPNGAIAWALGKAVTAQEGKGARKTLEAPSTAMGLGFAPKGYRLAIGHYGGATLWYPGADTTDALKWAGSHLDAAFSPDGRFVITSMQENALHGWRLTDKANMRMSGYPAKTRSWSWSGDGAWLATSGADGCIVWPFGAKDGPMGKAPKECGVRRSRVTAVAFHPKVLVLAVGYDDGCVLMCRLTDGSELLVRRAAEARGRAVTALAWDGVGARLLIGDAAGGAGLLTLPS